MQANILRYYRVNKTFMSQIGIWPSQSKPMRILIPIVLAVIDITYLMAEMTRMLDTLGDVDIAVECMISIIVVIACFTKLLNLSFRINQMRYLFSLIEYHWQVFNNPTDVEILQDYVIFSRKVVIFYAIYVYSSTSLYLLMPMSPQILDIVMPLNESRPRKFLFEVEYHIDREKYYYFILFHSYVAVIAVMSIVVCADTTYIVYVQHGCSLFAAIGYRLEHIVSEDQASSFMDNEETTCRGKAVEDIYFKQTTFRELVICLRKHQLAIQYARILESAFRLSTGIQLACNMLALSLIGIQVMSNLGRTDELIRYISLCAGAFFHLLCMSLPGQRLMDHSVNIFDKVYRSHWYTFSLESKRLLRILLYRSIVPCTLTAGKIYVMSMANYSMVRTFKLYIYNNFIFTEKIDSRQDSRIKTAYDIMHAEMEKYYASNKLFLSRVGGWPYQHKTLKVLLPIFLTIIQCSFLATQIILLHDTWGDVDIAIESMISFFVCIGSNMKLMNIIINNSKFRRLLRLMSNHWSVFNSKSERYILKYYADIGQKITKYYAAYLYTILVLYLFIPLIPRILDIVIPLNESRPLNYVVQAEYRVDKEKYYYLILFHIYIITAAAIAIILSIDTMYVICVLHACSLFTAISHSFENIVGQTSVKTNDNEKIRTRTHLFIERHDSINDDYHELMKCLKKHQLALEYVHLLDSMFTHVMFALISFNMLILSIIGLQIINKLGHTEEVIRNLCICIGAFIHLICMCFPGQLLIDRSTEVFHKAYSSRWYTFSIKSKTLLKIFLNRSIVPSTLSAGKTFTMSMSLISSVMHTAMSYFTALGSIQ
ncbi:uncharacterized protein [Anoplolepis gracilipes]|uniref:uncharacterized protein n=1 Tax=Anoplolepis gracilipes TaxID=354296 RepID=UPI003BA3BB62